MWGATRRPRGWCRAVRGTHTSRASICTPTSPCRPPTARAWSSSAAYLLRPAVAQDRLRLLDDGRVVLTLKTGKARRRRAGGRPAEAMARIGTLADRSQNRISSLLRPTIASPRARRGRKGGFASPVGGRPCRPSSHDLTIVTRPGKARCMASGSSNTCGSQGLRGSGRYRPGFAVSASARSNAPR